MLLIPRPYPHRALITISSHIGAGAGILSECPACGSDEITPTTCEICGQTYAECYACGWIEDPAHA